MTETMDFAHLTIEFDDRVLRPRPWTADQSRWAADVIAVAPDGPVLELCAGAGHIGLLAVALEPRSLVAVDLNPAACELNRRNAERAGLAELVEVRQGRIEEVLDPDESFAVVIADPPWVPRAGIGRFPEDPVLAIDGGEDGLDVARACLIATATHLAPGGTALLQLGDNEQAGRLGEEMADLGLGLAEVRQGERGVLVRIVHQGHPA